MFWHTLWIWIVFLLCIKNYLKYFQRFLEKKCEGIQQNVICSNSSCVLQCKQKKHTMLCFQFCWISGSYTTSQRTKHAQ